MTVLEGNWEAEARFKAMLHQKNTGKIAYPSATNDRGHVSSSHREHHAHGERVGGSIGSGGTHMKPLEKGMAKGNGAKEEGHAHSNAIKQAHAGLSKHKEGGPTRGSAMKGMKDGQPFKRGGMPPRRVGRGG